MIAFDPETQLSQRILGEYREMPGLRLTVAQAARLWGLDVDRCQSLLDVLVSDGRLARGGNGQYCSGAAREWVQHQPVPARLREFRRVGK